MAFLCDHSPNLVMRLRLELPKFASESQENGPILLGLQKGSIGLFYEIELETDYFIDKSYMSLKDIFPGKQHAATSREISKLTC